MRCSNGGDRDDEIVWLRIKRAITESQAALVGGPNQLGRLLTAVSAFSQLIGQSHFQN
jgi:hypothetical protein